MTRLSTRFSDALLYAADAHAGQTRKGTGTPYVAHVLGVASLAIEFGAKEDEAIAALLHDVVEDAGGLERERDVRARFGDVVGDIIMGCTDSTSTPKPPWRERKERHLAYLAKATPSILLVSACDKLHNARSIVSDLRCDGERVWTRFNGGKDGSLWYYQTMADVLARLGAPDRLCRELRIAVTEMARLATMNTSADAPSSLDAAAD